MNRCITRKSILFSLVALILIAAFAGGALLPGSASHTNAAGATHVAQAKKKIKKIVGAGNTHPVCGRFGKNLQASSGAQMFCFGAQSNGMTLTNPLTSNISFGSNVDAANPLEDRSPSNVQADGQSEVSIASAGSYAVEAWNDATGFLSPPCSSQNKDQLTGFGFSNNGGVSFLDLGGLPNSGCATSRTAGDPSVEAYQVGGSTYFYISSIFIPLTIPQNELSVTACQVLGSGSSAVLSCGNPIVAAISTQCDSSNSYCSFLDKEYLSIDAARGRLYMSYTEFGINFSPPDTLTNGQIELAVCDLSTPTTPTCFSGSNTASPYFIVAPGDLSCEREGAYPAVDPQSGGVYVAHEFNWATNIYGTSSGPTDCRTIPTQNQIAYVPFSCLPLAPTSPCTAPAATNAVKIFSLDATPIPGYNRFPANDFPRIAVSDSFGAVSMVWNDTRTHVLGDIFLKSFNLVSLIPVQAKPVQINNDTSGALHFLPALRNVDANGNLNISWFDRRPNPNTGLTNVYAALSVNPRTTKVPVSNTLITTGPTDWDNVASLIVPNFGDYTDNYSVGTITYIAWSDGRIGVPQPFEAHT